MKHLTEATIQAFLDAELTDREMKRATDHFAVCELCANALLEAEAGQAEINLAFSAEAVCPCPSQRIWARIENEIEFSPAHQKTDLENTKSWWPHFGALLAPPQIAFAGGVAAIVLISFFVVETAWQNQSPNRGLVAENSQPQTSPPESRMTPVAPPEMTSLINQSESKTPPRATKIAYHPKTIANQKPKIENRKPLDVLPEERGYLNSIAELSKAVQTSDEFVMRPSFRVDYERNLAIMDNAISAMQKQVRSHPSDENAKRILFASYQNKIELLNTVTEKSQMIASLR